MKFPYKKNKTLLLENESPLTCIMKGKATLSKVISPYMIEECELIDKLPEDTTPVLMGDCLNDEHEDSIRKDLVDRNDTKVNDKVREISIKAENKDVIYKSITDKKQRKIWTPKNI